MPVCRIAYFISPHGFGHATRSAAILGALFKQEPDAQVVIFSRLPSFIFESLPQNQVSFEEAACDIGLVQRSPTEIDEEGTKQALAQFWPPNEDVWRDCLKRLASGGFSGVVCDIAPLGIWLAEKANLPSILVENFTWDWIYRGLKPPIPDLRDLATRFEKLNASVGLRIQTEPWCFTCHHAAKVGPIARPLKETREKLRDQVLGGKTGILVMLTMGGLMQRFESFQTLKQVRDVTFLLPGTEKRDGNVFGLGFGRDFYHPDWVAASDMVIGKLGYSTATEALQAGTPFGYIDRPEFPESAILAEYLSNRIPTFQIDSLAPQSWNNALQNAAILPRVPPAVLSGAEEAAGKILNFLT